MADRLQRQDHSKVQAEGAITMGTGTMMATVNCCRTQPSAGSSLRLIFESYLSFAFCICWLSWTGKLALEIPRMPWRSQWLIAFVRVNIGNAVIFGLQNDLKLKQPVEYNTALTIFFIPYILFEIPSNLFLRRLKPNVWCTSALPQKSMVQTNCLDQCQDACSSSASS